jgi:hypothetical protein
VLWAVRWYCRYGVSYRDLEQMMGEGGVSADHSTIYRNSIKSESEPFLRADRGALLGSDSHLVDVELIGANNARLKEIELPSAIHLAFDELQLCDLTLGLSV